jgi:hypothetical protein
VTRGVRLAREEEDERAPETRGTSWFARTRSHGGPGRVTTLFNKLLALQGAFVRRVEFGPLGIVVDVAKRHRRHRCPRCTFSTRARYDRTVREWRHLSLGRWRVDIRAVLCRLVCPEHASSPRRGAGAGSAAGAREVVEGPRSSSRSIGNGAAG